LRRKKYDLVIDFQGLFRSAFFAGISSHRAGAVYGFDSPRERIARYFYSRKAGVSLPHAVEKNVELVNFILSADHAVPSPVVPVNEKLLDNLPAFPRPYILLLPGARWESKYFPAALFAKTALAVNRSKKDIHFVTAGSKAEIRRSAELCAALPAGFPVTDLTGKTTLNELFALISQADAVVCNDSGPMHIAALLEKPVFAFFGPTDPEKTGPWKQRSRVFTAGCDCALCMNKNCPRPETLCHNIDPEAVSQLLLKQLYQENLS
jgi:ADP-heptose:LPS heptosyltransferase